jgi:hypothetical protein
MQHIKINNWIIITTTNLTQAYVTNTWRPAPAQSAVEYLRVLSRTLHPKTELSDTQLKQFTDVIILKDSDDGVLQ